MSLLRPMYSVTVTNHTKGWTFTHTQGDKISAESVCELIDPFELTWGYESNVPGPLAPDTASVTIWARTAAALPDIDAGDLLTAILERPTAGAPIPYMRFDGRVSDPALSLQRNGIVCQFLATDLTTDLRGDNARAADLQYFGVEAPRPRMKAIATWADFDFFTRIRSYGVDVSSPDGYFYDTGTLPLTDGGVGGDSWGEIINSNFAGSGWTDNLPVLRYAYAQRFDYDGTDAPGSWAHIFDLPIGDAAQHWTDTIEFYAQHYCPIITDPESEVTVISARHLPVDGIRPRKRRRDAVNRVSVEYVLAAPEKESEGRSSETFELEVAVERWGPVTRQIKTNRYGPLNPFQVTPYLPDETDLTASWAADSFAINLASMTDDQLDYYAPRFYPQRYSYPDNTDPGNIAMTLLVRDVASKWAFAGNAFASTVAGATFTVEGGRLTITPQLQTTAHTPDAADFPDLTGV